MNPQLIIALIIAAGSFGSAWQIQSWRHDAEELARAEQILADQRLAAATTIRRQDNVIAAQNEAETRAGALRVAAASARNELDGLRTSAASALRTAASNHNTCLERATTLSELFIASSTEYESLAEKAGRHTNDIQKLRAAWPKE